MMKWRHECSTEWLDARRHVITATEIKSLLPEYKRQMKKDPGALFPGFVALWAEKTSDIELDPVSVNAAARGHIMEPYAVKEWNRQRDKVATMYHWDDCIVAREGVGFSPDALNIPQEDRYPIARATELLDASMLLEIKSYEPKAHVKKFLEDQKQLDELLQIAVAFHVMPQLKEARLVFYCPQCKQLPMFERAYLPEHLEEQIEMAEKIIGKWKETAKRCKEEISNAFPLNVEYTERQIYDEWIASQPDDAWQVKG